MRFSVETLTPSTERLTQHTSSSIKPAEDPLIAKSWQREQYIGVTILLLCCIAAIGFFNHRVEGALIFAMLLSFGLILLIFCLFFIA